MSFDAIFLDVDGTLTTSRSVWLKALTQFGLEKESMVYYEQVRNGEIDYRAKVRLDTGLLKGRTYTDLMEALKPIELVDGAKEGVALIKDRSIPVILVSGGIDLYVDEILKLVGADLAFSNSIGFTDGLIDGSVSVRVGESKLDTLNLVSEEHGFDLAYCGAIGDGFNDIPMLQGVGASVAFNPKKKVVEDAATAVVRSESFLDAVNALFRLLD